MMPAPSLDAAAVTPIAAAATACHPELELMGVTVEGGSDYVEILVRLRGCRSEPCVVTVGVFRDLSAEALRAEIDRRLGHHVAEHRRSSGDSS
jgi:hypothetical protein